MSISKTKNYLVLNYNSSPVSVSTKHESYLISGGTLESPGALPMTFDEIAVINSTSPAFKIGLLGFEKSVEEEMYDALCIPQWKDILTADRIEHILLNPTMDDLAKILAIENVAYFERVRGVLMGLKNAGYDVSSKVDRMIEQRRRELANHQRKTSIKLIPAEKPEQMPSKEEFDAMKEQLAAMQAMMAQMMNNQEGVVTEPKTEPAKKSATRKTTKTTAEK